MKPIIRKVIKNAGGQAALAKKLGVSHQAIQQWEKVPAARVLQVEELTGISRHDLRSDIFGPAPEARAA